MDSKLSKISLNLPPPPPIPPETFLTVKKPSLRSVSTSLLPRPTKSFTTTTHHNKNNNSKTKLPIPIPPIPSLSQQLFPLLLHPLQQKRTIINHTLIQIEDYLLIGSFLFRPSTSTLSITSTSTSTSSPLKMIGSSSHYARVLLQCLGSSFLIDTSNTIVKYQPQSHHHYHHKDHGKKYLFDYVSNDLNSLFNNINNSVNPILSHALNGCHGTILSYGSADAGKSSVKLCNDYQSGVIAQSIMMLFNMIYQKANVEYLLRVSYYEIYNDELYDLLCPSNSLSLHQTKKRGTYVHPLTEEIVTSPTDIFSIIQKGQGNLYLHHNNDYKQNSHLIFQLVIESYDYSNISQKRSHIPGVSSQQKNTKISQLMFVDLANSLKPPEVSVTNINSQSRKRNKDIGLSIFESIVLQSTGKEKSSTLFDRSKLTRLLESTLTGQSNLLSICTIQDQFHSQEFLKFASRLRKLLISPKLNEMVEDQSMLLQYRKERSRLKLKLKQLNMNWMQGSNNQSIPINSQQIQWIRNELNRQLLSIEEKLILPIPVNKNENDSNGIMEEKGEGNDSIIHSSSPPTSFVWEFIKELGKEKQRLEENNHALKKQLVYLENQITMMERQKYVMDNFDTLQEELNIAKTELEVTQLLVSQP
ncbi:unnamed protein product [Cunninghamella blakesleeana]